MTISVITHNLCTGGKIEHMNQTVELLVNVLPRFDILFLQETRWNGHGDRWCVFSHQTFRCIWSGEDGGQAGVAIILREGLGQTVINIGKRSKRILEVNCKLNEKTPLKLISCYAPAQNNSREREEEFMNFLEELTQINRSAKNQFAIYGGDFNARVGHCELEQNSSAHDQPSIKAGIGPFGFGKSNNRGLEFALWSAENNLVVTNTWNKVEHERNLNTHGECVGQVQRHFSTIF